jgi:hypothetical protein
VRGPNLAATGELAHGDLIDQIGPRGPRIAALVRWLEAGDVDVTKASESTTGRIYNVARVQFRGDRETSQRAFRIATDLGMQPSEPHRLDAAGSDLWERQVTLPVNLRLPPFGPIDA